MILISCQELDQAQEKPFTIRRQRERRITVTGGVVSPHRRDNKTKRARIKTCFTLFLHKDKSYKTLTMIKSSRTHRIIIQEHDNTCFCLPPPITPESAEQGRTLYTDTTSFSGERLQPATPTAPPAANNTSPLLSPSDCCEASCCCSEFLVVTLFLHTRRQIKEKLMEVYSGADRGCTRTAALLCLTSVTCWCVRQLLF